MKYQKKLDDNLTDAPTKGKLEELQIYVRPPKNMTGPTQTFQMTVVEPGKFDVESSFIEQDKQSLHLLARVKRPKTPSKKAPTPAETTPRGDFNTDVVELVKNVYGTELEVAVQGREEAEQHVQGQDDRPERQERADLSLRQQDQPLRGGPDLRVSQGRAQRINPKIGLCLESFAVGEKARRAFAGRGETDDEVGGEGPAEESAPRLLRSERRAV